VFICMWSSQGMLLASADQMTPELEGAPTRSSTSEYDLDWLQAHKERHGRPLRVLHVGNIANNAYLNAKFLRSVGIDAHVLSRDYYHVMATPEWEELELRDGHGDDYQPRFSARDLGGYERPAWFVNAPLVSSPALIAELCG
jgi:hypothetical protein